MNSEDDQYCRLDRSDLHCSGYSEIEIVDIVPKSKFWSELATRYKEHIESQIPSDEFYLLEEEFEEIREHDLEYARMQVNQKKNRYGNILPYDQTRVKLTCIDGEDGSDYINATYVGLNAEYIATQAPTPASLGDFWRMVYERNTQIIVMLTREYEGRKLKSHRYWPDKGEETHNGITISLQTENSLNGYTIRELLLQFNGEQRKIYQFHYIAWPDHGVPQETKALIDILDHVDQLIIHNLANSPIVVHCSAGIGRTGTFILIHTKLRLLRNIYDSLPSGADTISLPTISLMDILRSLRHQRFGMVTQRSQFLFCYEVLLEKINKLSQECDS